MAEAKSLKRLNPGVRPLLYDINLAVNPDQAEFSGIVEIEISCALPQATLELHALGLTFDSIQLLQDGSPAKSGKAEPAGQGLIAVAFDQPLPAGANHLRFAYRGPFAKGLEGLYRARNGLTWGAFTQFQALGARRCFPCFDEPAFKASFTMTLRVPDTCEAFSNGEEVDRSDKDGIRTIRFAPTPPLSTYLVALAVGQFDVVNHDPVPPGPVARGPIPLRGIARRGAGKDLGMALQWTAAIVQAMETYFGIAYPFSKLDIVSVPDFAAGGMENAGLICYEESLILLDEDSTFKQVRDVLTTHAHEIAHHWVGNLVSPGWWDDLWLNESFATFMEAKVSHQLQPAWGYDTDLQKNAFDAMQLDLLPSVSRIHRPIVTQDEITTAFDAITYQKGAMAMAVLESEMGAGPFQSATQKLLQQNRYGTYDTGKFFSLFEIKARTRNNPKSFERLINQTGVPERVELSFIINDSTVPSYARARFTPKQWMQVFEDAPRLGRTEALRAVISLDLALQSREITLAAYLDGVKAFASHASWQAAGFALDRLSFLITELPQPAAIKRLASELYAPLLSAVGYAPQQHDDKFTDWHLITKRSELAAFFVASDADAATELDLLFFGLRLLDKPDDIFDAEWLPDEVKESALLAVMRTRRDDVADRIADILRQTDTGRQRDQLINVLAADTSTGAPGRMRALFADKGIRGEEIGAYLAARAGYPAMRDDLLDFIAASAPDLLVRLGGDADIGIIQFANAFTSDAHAKRLDAIIRPILGTIQGGEPQLRLTLERITLNARMLEHLVRHA